MKKLAVDILRIHFVSKVNLFRLFDNADMINDL